jgi:hypothetical protein
LHLSVYISGLDRFSIERLLSNFERQEEVKIHSRNYEDHGLIVSKRVHMLILNGQSLVETFGLKISPPHQQDVKII